MSHGKHHKGTIYTFLTQCSLSVTSTDTHRLIQSTFSLDCRILQQRIPCGVC